MVKQIEPGLRKGQIDIPASKSDAQRALLAAALTNGTSVLTGFGSSDDELAMLEAIQRLGANVRFAGEVLQIDGIHRFPASVTISAGESGLGIRLLTAVCAAHAGTFTIEGEGSLQTRPMTFFEQTLPLFGATCQTTSGNPPIQVTGPMHGTTAAIDGSLSSQFVSGLLMALPLVQGESELIVENPTSVPYVQMTLQTLAAFGITIRTNGFMRFSIPGNQRYRGVPYQIDADWSSASYWLVAAALGHNIIVGGLRPNSWQADKALYDFLGEAGCVCTTIANGYIAVNGSNLRPFRADATDCPDLFPALVTLAAFCKGTSILHGARRLEHKESNRALTLQSEFGKLGVEIELDDDRMLVHGTGIVNGGRVSSHNDHRIAMCLAIAGLSARSPIILEGAEAVDKSYPAFWQHLAALEMTFPFSI